MAVGGGNYKASGGLGTPSKYVGLLDQRRAFKIFLPYICFRVGDPFDRLRASFPESIPHERGLSPSHGMGAASPGPRKNIGAGERLACGVLRDPQ